MKKNNGISIRSSAVEYLTFIAATGDDKEAIEVRYEDENILLEEAKTIYPNTLLAKENLRISIN